MTSLEQQQRALLALIKKRSLPREDCDEYLRHVGASDELGLVREIALWWRALGIERNCPLTAKLLRKIGRFEPAVESFYCRHATSPYMEEMAVQFLEAMSVDSDPLMRAMAAFELAMARVAQGDPREFVIEWDRDPTAVLTALRMGDPLPQPDGLHRTTVGGAQSDLRSEIPIPG
ncbi:MAG: hypothetical protein LAP13_05695 [Acidobacteriia bacterium]|nr:hypothetical protein [Terriglobia bacterium]